MKRPQTFRSLLCVQCRPLSTFLFPSFNTVPTLVQGTQRLAAALNSTLDSMQQNLSPVYQNITSPLCPTHNPHLYLFSAHSSFSKDTQHYGHLPGAGSLPPTPVTVGLFELDILGILHFRVAPRYSQADSRQHNGPGAKLKIDRKEEQHHTKCPRSYRNPFGR